MASSPSSTMTTSGPELMKIGQGNRKRAVPCGRRKSLGFLAAEVAAFHALICRPRPTGGAMYGGHVLDTASGLMIDSVRCFTVSP